MKTATEPRADDPDTSGVQRRETLAGAFRSRPSLSPEREAELSAREVRWMDLWVRASRGDSRAIAGFRHETARPLSAWVRRWARGIDEASLDGIVADVWDGVIRKWRSDAPVPSRTVTAWLATVARNKAFAWLKKNRGETTEPYEDSDPEREVYEIERQRAEAEEKAMALREALAKLPEPHRTAMTLSVRGLNAESVGARLSPPRDRKTVERIKREGLVMLRGFLGILGVRDEDDDV